MSSRSRKDASASSPAARGLVRLQKYLSDAGVASRRRAEDLIREGRVSVNGRVVDTLPAFVDPHKDRVVCDGVRVRPQPHIYVLMNKPKGVVCSTRDPAGRPRVYDLLPDLPARVFPVGRLDVDSSGLLLLTNDGELAERILHPRYGLPKVYRVEVRGMVPADLPERLLHGVHLSDGRATAARVQIVHRSRQRSALLVTVREGRNRLVRRMLARLGYKVKALRRIRIGSLEARGLAPGACRLLSRAEVDRLRRDIERLAAPGTATAPTTATRSRSPGRRRSRKASGSTQPLPPITATRRRIIET